MTDLIKTAHDLYNDIVSIKEEIGRYLFELAGRLKLIRDQKLYKHLDCDTFKEFYSQPEIALKESTVYNYIALYETYVEKLGIPQKRLQLIGPNKLQVIHRVVHNNSSDWLDRAEHLSVSDLVQEVRQARGESSSFSSFLKTPSPDPCEQAKLEALKLTDYIELVEHSPCCVCGNGPVDKHHFPKTRGAGASEWKVIPLCRYCHSEYGNDPKEFLWQNRHLIFDFFYDIIREKFGIKEEG